MFYSLCNSDTELFTDNWGNKFHRQETEKSEHKHLRPKMYYCFARYVIWSKQMARRFLVRRSPKQRHRPLTCYLYSNRSVKIQLISRSPRPFNSRRTRIKHNRTGFPAASVASRTYINSQRAELAFRHWASNLVLLLFLLKYKKPRRLFLPVSTQNTRLPIFEPRKKMFFFFWKLQRIIWLGKISM